MNVGNKVFVIGGTGYIGYHLCRELVDKGYDVTALSFDDVPAGFLPPTVKIIKANINDLADADLAKLFAKQWGFIFAAGADDRLTPKAPSYPFFYNANVKSLERLMIIAKAQGVKRVVVLNSYFAYFNRIWPEMHLAEHHPYIRSRKEQQEMAFRVGGTAMPVAVVELPYIVGTTPGKGSLWQPLVEYVNSLGATKFYTKGGTAVTSVRNVGLALANALERTTVNTIYQVGDMNMTWAEWLQSLVKDPKKKLKIVTVPKWLVKFAGIFIGLSHKLQGKEGGLDMIPFVDLQTRETFIPVKEANAKLGYLKYDVMEDFKDTIDLCLKNLK